MNLYSAFSYAPVFAIILALYASAADSSPENAVTDETHFHEVANLLLTQDSFAALQYIERQGAPQEVMSLYFKTAQWLHYTNKDVAGMIAISRAGIHYGLAQAERLQESDPETAEKLRGTAKAMSFNLGANTWPGWDDEGIVVTDSDAHIGLDAAKLNLRLAIELKRDPLPLCNAHWLLGVHLMVAGEEDAAAQELQNAIEQARAAEREDFEMMCCGYVAIARFHADTNNAEHGAELDRCVAELKRIDTEDSRFFADQLVSVHKTLMQRLSEQ
ncbi:MAG: hypothetical protein DWQ34_08970 [Planctomycetota bacterium]|nr:MAG: hypothetical protein DWQ34_08970 [Planctomycetota bacterium]REK20183.1 MAG: hypothetical protein DWQ41_25910 [Planctomycetota bacterium]REK35363.1 MAG: hypothetical protein DWQ45_11615 [Planctomycetota bacterium]